MPSALGNSRIVTVGPLSASGGRTTLTRAPRGSRESGGRRASTMGLDSSTRRLTVDTMRSMVCSSCSSLVKPLVSRSSRPKRSTKISSWPLIMISLTAGSASSGSRTPRPIDSSTTRRTSRLRSRVVRMIPSREMRCAMTRSRRSRRWATSSRPSSWRSTSSSSMPLEALDHRLVDVAAPGPSAPRRPRGLVGAELLERPHGRYASRVTRTSGTQSSTTPTTGTRTTSRTRRPRRRAGRRSRRTPRRRGCRRARRGPRRSRRRPGSAAARPGPRPPRWSEVTANMKRGHLDHEHGEDQGERHHAEQLERGDAPGRAGPPPGPRPAQRAHGSIDHPARAGDLGRHAGEPVGDARDLRGSPVTVALDRRRRRRRRRM